MEKKHIKKSDLVGKIALKHQELTRGEVEQAIDTIIDEVSTALVCGDRVELRGFGSLVVRKRKKGLARNPKSGQKVEVDERGSLYFRASRDLVKQLNTASSNDNVRVTN
ncbi:MAG: HU family DNA-binding protein [Rickettsiales bacterium]